MSAILTSLLAFVVAIALLVAIHEFGHFWVARRLGVRVLRFSIGFGKPLWRRTGADGTEYVISNIPLGGYVKMLDERDCDVRPEERRQAFNCAPIPARLAILAAGPAFNFLFAIAAYWLMFMVGVPGLRPVIGDVSADSYAARAGLAAGDTIVRAGGADAATWQDATLAILDDLVDDGVVALRVRSAEGRERDTRIDVGADKTRLTEPGELLDGLGLSPWPASLPARIGEVVPGEAADRAGLRSGDLIVKADGEAVAGWREWVEFVRERPGQRVFLAVERDGRTERLDLDIGVVTEDGAEVGRIGAAVVDPMADLRIEQRYGPFAAAGEAIAYTGEMTAFTLRMLWRMVSGDFSAKNLSGPINIAQYAGATASVGPKAFLGFLAIVSISLGILNLLPVPMLDGGQIVFQLAEAVKGSPLSPRTEVLGQQFGIVLLLMLMSLAFYNDIARLVG